MTLFRALRVMQRKHKLQRAHWPPDLFLYITPKTEEIKLQYRIGWKTFFADGLAEKDCKANDWIII